MCGQRDESLLLDDMVQACTRLMQLGPSLSDRFEPDRDIAEMVQWNLVQLGEAAKRLPNAVRDRFPDVEWTQVMRTRDRVTHHYEGINWFRVREMAVSDAPALLPRLVSIREILRAEADSGPS